jgi:hypothetical protein
VGNTTSQGNIKPNFLKGYSPFDQPFEFIDPERWT